jgi:hypothetical protein
MRIVRCKAGVQFAIIAPGGFEILRAITEAAMGLSYDVMITSGTDGTHSGPNDPHHRGEAYDVHTKDVPDKQELLYSIMKHLAPDQFYGFIEDENMPNEHIHVQVKKGTVYPPIVGEISSDIESGDL